MNILNYFRNKRNEYVKMARKHFLPRSGWHECHVNGFHWRLSMGHYLDRSFIIDHAWESNAMKCLDKMITPGMCVMDIGANVGMYSLPFSRMVGKSGSVIAIEPTDEYSSRLLWHLSRNGIENVHVEKIGFSDKEETIDISVCDDSATLHWSVDFSPRKKERITLMPLDLWWKHYCAHGHEDRLDVIKIDTDGHEPMVIKGAEQTLRRLKPVLLIEFVMENLLTYSHTPWELADQLEQLGYTLCSEKDGRPYKDRRMLLKDLANYASSANAIAIPRSTK